MKVYIFHGWGGSSKENWFPWLKNELIKEKVQVIVPDFPDSEHPKLVPWMKMALELQYDEETILVGHSLGSVLIMRLIEKGVKLKKAFLVANFDDYGRLEEISDFFRKSFDYEKIKKSDIVMLSSDNDPYIPLGISESLAKKLSCKHIIFKGMRHLSSGTGGLKFPELKELIMK